MKMCSISVAPIPSISLIPVASCQACQVGLGNVSPADTHTRKLSRSPGCRSPSIARYAVGAVKQTVGRRLRIVASSASGDACSSRMAAAPIRNGISTTAPSPNVKARGAVPMNRSSGRARSTCRAYPSQIASMSRWKCIVPFGSPW